MIDELRKNIDSEIQILREIVKCSHELESASEDEKRILNASIKSLKESMRIVNKAIPELLENISTSGAALRNARAVKLERVSFKRETGEISAVLNREDREKFVKELGLNERLIRKIVREKPEEEEELQEFKTSRGYLKLANKFFLNVAEGFVNEDKFNALSAGIKKANFEVLTETYVAMMFFTTFVSFFAAIFLMVLLLFFNIGVGWPFITLYSGNYLLRILKLIWLPIVIPILTYTLIYIYPSLEKGSIAKKIEGELPFAVIHMSAVSGSGIAPVEIFKIIGTSKDYPVLGREIRKVLNQINLYGYDLVTALNNVSKSTPSTKLAELFSGITTTVNSGGNLQAFFEKRAETLLMDYRLQREKYTRTAETFMDIYITVVVAAPMILMLLLIMIVMTGFQINFTPGQITLILITIIALINIIFLGLLQTKQPGY